VILTLVDAPSARAETFTLRAIVAFVDVITPVIDDVFVDKVIVDSVVAETN
jgi:hypothetical protein